MPSGQPMSSWSATAFCPVFGESAARTLLVYRMGPSFCCRPPTEDRLGAKLWGARPAVPSIPFKTKERATTFFAKAKEKNSTDIAPKNPNQAIVSSDNDDFPLPIPVVKRKSPRFSLCPIAREQCATHDAELISHERGTVGYSFEDISSHALLSGMADGHVASARAVR